MRKRARELAALLGSLLFAVWLIECAGAVDGLRLPPRFSESRFVTWLVAGTLALPVFALGATIWRAEGIRRRRRRSRLRWTCRGCGYDLRASEGRCPECGRAFGVSDLRVAFTSRSQSRLARRLRRPVGRRLYLLLWVTAAMTLWQARLPGYDPDRETALAWVWASILIGHGLVLLGGPVFARLPLATRRSHRRYAWSAACLLLVSLVLALTGVPARAGYALSRRALVRVASEIAREPLGVRHELESQWIGVYYVSGVSRCPHAVYIGVGDACLVYRYDRSEPCEHQSPSEIELSEDWFTRATWPFGGR